MKSIKYWCLNVNMRSTVFNIFVIFQINQIAIGTRPGLRIIGGKDADEEKYPYIARLAKEVKVIGIDHNMAPSLIVFCTCTVLTSTWSLTAAHCFSEDKQLMRHKKITFKNLVQYGPINSSLTKDSVSEVLSIIKHPAYKLFNIGFIFTLQNDIALTKTKSIILKLYGRVSALDFVTLVGQEVKLAGYGITNSSEGRADDATALGKPLQMLNVVVIQCDKKINFQLSPAVCVARHCRKSSGVCPGDSGGPMLHSSGIAGVMSTAIHGEDPSKFCALKSKLLNYDVGTITPISPYIDWISDVMKEDN